MNTQAMRIFVCLIPVILIVVLILTTVLFVKRKEIIEKYNVGYISSFCFAAYMFAPLTIGIPMLIFMQEEEKFAILPLLLIYPIVGMIVFMIMKLLTIE